MLQMVDIRQPMAPKKQSLLSVTEAARLLGISRQRIHGLISAGRIEGHQYGNAYLVERSSVARYRANPPGRPPKASAGRAKKKRSS
jgi:excisionase family DNA binding protein